jgi:hypothetical protein
MLNNNAIAMLLNLNLHILGKLICMIWVNVTYLEPLYQYLMIIIE